MVSVTLRAPHTFPIPMNLRNLRILAMLEGTSLILLLFVAMPLKYKFGVPEATKIVGMIHGILFLSFISMLTTVTHQGKLPEKYSVIGLLAAFIPLGTWVFERKIIKPRI